MPYYIDNNPVCELFIIIISVTIISITIKDTLPGRGVCTAYAPTNLGDFDARKSEHFHNFVHVKCEIFCA